MSDNINLFYLPMKVVKVDATGLEFEDGTKLYSQHERDCCESHELYFQDLTIDDFDGLEFDLTDSAFFRVIPDYGIELMPKQGHSVKIAGHGSNNGYYSTNLTLVVDSGNGYIRTFNITECQDIHYS